MSRWTKLLEEVWAGCEELEIAVDAEKETRGKTKRAKGSIYNRYKSLRRQNKRKKRTKRKQTE